MGGWYVAAMAVYGAGQYLTYKGQEEAAEAQEEYQYQQAQQAKERALREERIAAERKQADISMAQERMDFEKKTRGEKAEFVKAQMAKFDAELYASAIAGYAASGIAIGEGSSALAVIENIQRESEVQQEAVSKEFEDFIASRELELEQLVETEELTYDWFTTRLHQETQWEIENRYAEAAAFRTKGKYARYGMYYGFASAGAKGYAMGSTLS